MHGFVCANPQIFFRVVHFLQGTCGLHIYTEADNSKKFQPYAFTALPARVSEFFYSLQNYNPKRVCCFDLRDFNWPPKRK